MPMIPVQAQPGGATTSPSAKDTAILSLKAIAIVGVVTHHILNRRIDPQAHEWLEIYPYFSWAVLLFFAVSGWLHALSQEKRGRTFGQFLAVRVQRLALPFIAVVILYSILWQVLQVTGVFQPEARVPSGFLQKIVYSLWPVNQTVADQLYFLPMLCVISIGAHGLVCIGGRRLIAVGTGLALLLGLVFFPTSPNVGFLPGVWAWGSFCYGAGFLIRTNKSSHLFWTCVGLLALAIFIRAGWDGWAKVLPIILLGAMYWLKLDRMKFLHPLGEASGTVYIYHQPFLLQGLLIGVSMIPVWQLQVVGVYGAAAFDILICSLYYFAVRGTRLKFTTL